MGEVTPLRPDGNPRRALFSDERGTGLRATWHPEHELVVLSLWRDDVCVGTFRMTPAEAHRLVDFLSGHLGAPGQHAEPRRAPDDGPDHPATAVAAAVTRSAGTAASPHLAEVTSTGDLGHTAPPPPDPCDEAVSYQAR